MSVLTDLPAPRTAVMERPAETMPEFRANVFARPLPEFEPFPPPRMTAWLNHTDRIICLPAHWDVFTAIIAAPGLAREQVLGRPVTWFIGDETIRECFRVMIERVRRENRPTRLAARCDSPEEARAMQLRFAPTSAGAIECSWTFLSGQAAREIPDAGTHRFAPGEHLRMCGWCRQVNVRGTWQKQELAFPTLGVLDHRPLPPITHGICPLCSTSIVGQTQRAV